MQEMFNLEMAVGDLHYPDTGETCELRGESANRNPTKTWNVLFAAIEPRRSSFVSVEPTSRFTSEPARGDVFLEQRARAILRVAKPFLQHVHNVHAHVQADEIGKLQRPHRMVHPQLHHRVHGFGSSHAFHHAVS